MSKTSVLSEEQIRQFRTEGYTVAERLFDADEVAAMQAEVLRFQTDGLIRNVSTDGDGSTHSKTKQNLQLCPMSPHSDLFKALPFDDRVKSAVGTLLDGDVVLHLDQIFLKPGLSGTGTGWHQDNTYFNATDPMAGTAMWIAVHDATIGNGTMRVAPNEWREPLPHERDPGSDHHLRCEPSDPLSSVALEIPAGSAAFFCYGTPHCTMGNNTTKPRAGAAFHFLRQDAIASSGQAQLFRENRDDRPVLTGPDATNGVKEYGSDWSGRFAEVVRSING